MPSHRADLMRWNAAQQAARDAYAHLRAHEDTPKRRRFCEGCGRRHYSLEADCIRCRTGARA